MSSPLQEIECNERMEIYDAPDATFLSRENIFYLHFIDESSHVADFCSSASKTSVLYLSTDSEMEKTEWIDALATSIHISCCSKYGIVGEQKVDEDMETVIFQPDIWPHPFQAVVKLTIEYGDDVVVNDGNCVKITQILNSSPRISFATPLIGHYVLLMVDLDSTKNTSIEGQTGEAYAIEAALMEKDEVYLHWAMVNISGSDIGTGMEVDSVILIL